MTGDLTHDGLIEQFEPVFRCLERFGIERVRAIPGNRDYPARNSTVGRPFDSDLEYFLGAPDTVFLDHEIPGLDPDSTPFTEFFPAIDFYDRFPKATVVGLDSEPEIPDASFKCAVDYFRGSSPSVPRVFCTHRSLLPVPRKKVKEGDLLRNAADMLAELLANKVRLVLCSHVHRANAWNFGDDHGDMVVVNSPSLIDSSGTKENGFIEIELDAKGGVTVDRHGLDGSVRRLLRRRSKGKR